MLRIKIFSDTSQARLESQINAYLRAHSQYEVTKMETMKSDNTLYIVLLLAEKFQFPSVPTPMIMPSEPNPPLQIGDTPPWSNEFTFVGDTPTRPAYNVSEQFGGGH